MNDRKNKNCYVYCRVSGTKQAQEGDSLEKQEANCRRKADVLGCAILPRNIVWREPYTGSKLSRPVFNEMVESIKKSKEKIDYLIFSDIDRLTRGGAGDYEHIKNEFEKLDIELIDLMGIIQPKMNTLAGTGFEFSWSKVSPSAMSEKIRAESAKSERSIILTRLIGAEIPLVQAGFHIGKPNDGFINKRIFVEGKKRCIQSPDPERAKYFVEMFNLRASGKYTDIEIVDKLNAMGYRTLICNRWDSTHTKIIGKIGGNKLTSKQLQRFVQTTNYCGISCRKWTHHKPIKAKSDGIVSIEKFNAANNGKVFIKEVGADTYEILFDYHPNKIVQKRSKDNPMFPYKSLVLCSHCGQPFMGSSSRGSGGKKFPAYHCSRKGHEYFGVNKIKFENDFENIIKGLDFSSDAAKAFKIAFEDTYHDRKEQLAQYKENVQNNAVILQKQQDDSMEAFKKTSSSIIREKLEREIEELEEQIAKAKQQMSKNGLGEYDVKRFLECAQHLMEHFEELLLDKEKQPLQKRLLALVFDETPTYEEVVNGTAKICFIFNKKRELALANSPIVGREGFEPPKA